MTKEMERENSPPLVVKEKIPKHQLKKAKKQVCNFMLCSFRTGDEAHTLYVCVVSKRRQPKRKQK